MSEKTMVVCDGCGAVIVDRGMSKDPHCVIRVVDQIANGREYRRIGKNDYQDKHACSVECVQQIASTFTIPPKPIKKPASVSALTGEVVTSR